MTTLHTRTTHIAAASGRRIQLACQVLLLGATVACVSIAGAGTTAAAGAQKRYEQERAVCMTGQSNQARATCLKEAGAAYEEAKHHALGAGEAPDARNALQRCEGLPSADRAACTERVQGQGTTTGSAAAGGTMSEMTVTTPAAAAAPQAPAAAPAR
ncbi:hypothetical protein JJB11_06025 [Ramlibacter ginsenosidimutans]|uniref:Uncharacterized protein n=1 Tax=Ramlibacter ginsenosidimutans TaxID=502333 RepID=A0A934WLH9_9BURK|nr:hypothetical protein [Ramlibacter ginsenosidimutans]MBK6005645.1 hypothetical protein [Ramlibacter ginsenosidimutans]